ncbi:MAG: SDR family oxidoreductase [Deltaproteobacteria bacterium]|nr:SDR family oxidoreductase [Deltaproteobacteria bacterium]
MGFFSKDILKGRVALVTGGGSGICQGIAEEFAAHGAQVAILGRKAEKLAEAAAAIRKNTGVDVLCTPADVRNTEQVEAAVKAAADKFGKLDILVNGAAGNFICPASQLSYNGYRTVVEIDQIGTFNMCKAAHEHLAKTRNASIINITATLQYVGTPFQIHAASAKAGVDAQTRILAVEWGPLGIRVNGIAPGPIRDTEGMKRLGMGVPETVINKGVPLGRMGTVKEMANTAVFLASDAASYITGTIIVADGGQWLFRPFGPDRM